MSRGTFRLYKMSRGTFRQAKLHKKSSKNGTRDILTVQKCPAGHSRLKNILNIVQMSRGTFELVAKPPQARRSARQLLLSASATATSSPTCRHNLASARCGQQQDGKNKSFQCQRFVCVKILLGRARTCEHARAHTRTRTRTRTRTWTRTRTATVIWLTTLEKKNVPCGT